jgi:hypothetical protein
MDPKRKCRVSLVFDVVVVSGYCLCPLQVSGAESTEESFLHQQRDLSSIFVGKPAREARIVEVGGAGIFPRP